MAWGSDGLSGKKVSMLAPRATAHSSAPSSGFQVRRTAAPSQPWRFTPTAARAVATENHGSRETDGVCGGVRPWRSQRKGCVGLAWLGLARDWGLSAKLRADLSQRIAAPAAGAENVAPDAAGAAVADVATGTRAANAHISS